MVAPAVQHTVTIIAAVSTMQCVIPTNVMADASVSEESVLGVVGQVSELPNPAWIVGVAAFIAVGVAVLQYSLGDISKAVRALFFRLQYAR
jgi:hypothetical protein